MGRAFGSVLCQCRYSRTLTPPWRVAWSLQPARHVLPSNLSRGSCWSAPLLQCRAQGSAGAPAALVVATCGTLPRVCLVGRRCAVLARMSLHPLAARLVLWRRTRTPHEERLRAACPSGQRARTLQSRKPLARCKCAACPRAWMALRRQAEGVPNPEGRWSGLARAQSGSSGRGVRRRSCTEVQSLPDGIRGSSLARRRRVCSRSRT